MVLAYICSVSQRNMISILRQLLLQTLSAFLIYALLLPFAIKLDHVFENHNHAVCNSKVESHIHESELDCDFYDYQINQLSYVPNNAFEDSLREIFVKKNFTDSSAFSFQQEAAFFLRGPPLFV